MYQLQERKPDLFEFEYKGKKYGVPTMDSLPFATFMRIRKKLSESDNPSELGFDEIMNLFESYAPDVMRDIDLSQAKELFMAYAQTGTELGKYSPSSE